MTTTHCKLIPTPACARKTITRCSTSSAASPAWLFSTGNYWMVRGAHRFVTFPTRTFVLCCACVCGAHTSNFVVCHHSTASLFGIVIHFVFILHTHTAFFIRPFYKMMLGKPITLRDMESVVSFSPMLLLPANSLILCLFTMRKSLSK